MVVATTNRRAPPREWKKREEVRKKKKLLQVLLPRRRRDLQLIFREFLFLGIIITGWASMRWCLWLLNTHRREGYEEGERRD